MYLLFSFHMFTSILSTYHTYVDSLYQLQCKIEWFHFGCVGLKEKPKGKWYCSNCAATRNRRRGKWGRQKNKIKCQNGWVYILNIFGTVVRALKLCFCSCLGRFWINFQWLTMSCVILVMLLLWTIEWLYSFIVKSGFEKGEYSCVCIVYSVVSAIIIISGYESWHLLAKCFWWLSNNWMITYIIKITDIMEK